MVWTSSWTFNFKHLCLIEALRDAVFNETVPSLFLPKEVFRGSSGVPAVTPDEAFTEVGAFSAMERLAVDAQLKEKVQKNP